MDLDIWLVGLTIFLLAYKYLRRGTGKKLPPGPLSFPVIGSPSLLGSSDIRKKLIKMAKQYGDVFTIFLGSSRVVVLNGYDAIYDAFAKNARVFSGRPKTFSFTEVAQGYGRHEIIVGLFYSISNFKIYFKIIVR